MVAALQAGVDLTSVAFSGKAMLEPVEAAAGSSIQDPSKSFEWSIAGGTADDVAQGKSSLGVIRAELRDVVAQRSASDRNLRYLDGRDLYGRADAAAITLPDNLHPGPDAQRHIGERFAELVLEPFTAGRRGEAGR